jgi:membrane protease YdiL (CAAX protease family)
LTFDYSVPGFDLVGDLLCGRFAYNKRMTLRYWLFVAGSLWLAAVIGYNTYQAGKLLRHWRPTGNLLLLPAENLLRLALIFVCVALGWLSGLDYAQLGWVWPADASAWLWGALWGVLLALFFAGSTLWIVRRTGQRFYSPVVVQAIVPHDRRQLLLVALAMGPVVLLEELLFRSLLLGGLASLAPVPLLVIGWSVVFGLLHSPQGRWGIVGAGLGGALLSWLFLHYGALATPLVAHYITNMMQVWQAMKMRDMLAVMES